MAGVNFYLKKPELVSGKSLIYLQFKFQSNKLVFSFGQSIDPANWNASKQRVKSNKQTTIDGDHSLNDLLDKLEQVCLRAYKIELAKGIPFPSQIKQYLEDYLNSNKESHNDNKKSLYGLIDRFINGEIKSKGIDKSKGTILNYKSVLLHLKAFEKHYKYPISFESINLDFFYKYVNFLRQFGNLNKKESEKAILGGPLSQNSIAKDIRLIKVFMSEAVDLGYTNNLQFKHSKFSISSTETDAVYLTETEIVKLYKTEMPNSKLENIKDLFVFGCFVGLRFSDFSNVKPENIVQADGDYYIRIITAKTGELVIIPCNPIVLDIFKRYESSSNKLPRSVSNQKFNDYIKEVCKIAKLSEAGRLINEPEKLLHDCISSHTARRSFATNLYLAGFPTLDIMKITGHKTEKAFMKYIKTTKLDTAKRLNSHIKRNWNQNLLRVAG